MIRQWMKLIILLGVTLSVHGQNRVSKPVGFVRIVVPGNSQMPASIPFDAFDASVDAVLAGQLTGAPDEADADHVLMWDAASQQYHSVFKADGLGDSQRDGRWFVDDVDWIPSTLTLNPGNAFWLQNNQGTDQSVFLFGKVPLTENRSVSLYSGLNLFGYPFSSKIALNDSDLSGDGAFGGATMLSSDRVIEMVDNTFFWLLDNAGAADHGKWLNDIGLPTKSELLLGRGYWYERAIAGTLVWDEIRPYADVFPADHGPPEVIAMVLAATGDAITLNITTRGTVGELLDIFYQDVGPSDPFSSDRGWLLADTGLMSNASGSISWVDDGAGERGPVDTVFARFYLIGRADIDSDGDELPDVRETFVTGTDPASVDSDGDGLTDGEEVVVFRTSPLLSDSDVDGLTDNDEISIFHTAPNSADSDNDSLPDGWEVSNGLDPNDPDDAANDPDGDWIPSVDEFEIGTTPTMEDTDGDGMSDTWELLFSAMNDDYLSPSGLYLDPLDNGAFDRNQSPDADLDNDGLTNIDEYNWSNAQVFAQMTDFCSALARSNPPGLHPTDPDTDNDGVDDGEELQINLTDPLVADQAPAHDALPHQDSPVKQNEHMALLALVPYDAVTNTAISSGSWFDTGTWEQGVVPADHANVLIPNGIVVTVDDLSHASLRTVRINGTLRFDPSRNTALRVDTLIVDPAGALEMGTAAIPIDPGVTARILVADRGPIDRVWDPSAFSRGVISHGTTTIYGAETTAYLPLAVAPSAGDTQLVLDREPLNWNVGDEVVVPGTHAESAEWEHSEVRVILEIVGNVITVEPLTYDHLTPREYIPAHVAHLTRNALIESENAEMSRRGHVMFMHTRRVDINYAGFYHLGRSNKRVPADDPQFDQDGNLIPGTGTNPRGRYAVHFHRNGVHNDGAPARVHGSVVVDSRGWGYVNHSSFVLITGNVAYNVDGAAFVTEAGDEIGRFENNLAIHSVGSGEDEERRLEIHDFGHEGAGFWFQGAGIDVLGNIAAGQRRNGFIFFTRGLQQEGLGTTEFLSANLVDPSIANGRETIRVGAVPITAFRGNTAYSTRHGVVTAFHMREVDHDVWSVLDETLLWNNKIGVELDYTEHTIVRNATIISDLGDWVWSGVAANRATRIVRYENLTVEGYHTGISVPLKGETTIVGGWYRNQHNIGIDGWIEEWMRRVVMLGNPHFDVTGDDTYHVYMNIQIPPGHGIIERLFWPQEIILDVDGCAGQRVYYREQAPGFVPFPEASDGIPVEYIGKTNQELFDEFGIAIGGEPAPVDAGVVAAVHGLIDSPGCLNSPPIAVDDNYMTGHDAPLTVENPGILANDTDLDQHPLTATLVVGPANGIVTLEAGGSFIYTPAAGFSGSDSFHYRASDGFLESNIGVVTITVLPSSRDRRSRTRR